MNNPLVQRAQYYLNESHRLTEELNTEIEYSAVLEAVLEELIGTEDFLKIMEVYANPGSIDLTASGGERSNKPGRNNKAHVTHRIGQIGKILAARQSKPVDNDLTKTGNTPDHVEWQASKDRQGAKDAGIAFKTHGGQVDFHGNLLPSASNDNKSGIRMTDAKKEGVPVLVNPRGNKDPEQDVGEVNKNRLERKSRQTQKALSARSPHPGSFEQGETKREYAIRTNAEKAKKARIAAGHGAAIRSGMVTMPEHSNLVQTIMKFLGK